jgi:hypothetical protein
MRRSPDFNALYLDDAAARATIKPRTHDESVLEAKKSDDFEFSFDNEKHPRKVSGINSSCRFTLLHLFHLIEDIMQDYMHMSKGVIKDHVMGVLKGERGGGFFDPAAALLALAAAVGDVREAPPGKGKKPPRSKKVVLLKPLEKIAMDKIKKVF